MISYNKETPILLVALGKVETIRMIYNHLSRIEPQRLYLFYDAPADEEHQIEQERIKAIFRGIDWACKVKICSGKKPLGEYAATKQAVRRFFNLETEGIVLNGNSVPPPAFFAFCSCLLEKYRFDERIGHISGRDFQKPETVSKTSDSYYYSKLVHTTDSWASWRRVLKDMEVKMKTLASFKKQNIIEEIPTHKPCIFLWFYLNILNIRWEDRYEYVNLINNRLSVVMNKRQIPLTGYELPEINHPTFMVSVTTEELKAQEEKFKLPAITRNEPDGTTFLQQQLFSFKTEACRRMKIPRIIHQIYEDPAGPPQYLLEVASTWKEKMPDWEYRFWNKQLICDFLTSVCPDFKNYYSSYPFDVQRWDAMRYLILYHIGGLYADMDYECIRPLDVLLSSSTCCMGMEPTVNTKIFNRSLIVGNALMASTPKHPYMAAIIEDMKTNFSINYGKIDSMQIMETTGPFMTTRVYERFKRKKNITLLPADLVYPLTREELSLLRTGHKLPDLFKKIDKAFAIHYSMVSWTDQIVS